MVDIEDVNVREVLNHMEKYSAEKNRSINKFMLTQVYKRRAVYRRI